jgi:hypothetical protein
VVPINSSLLTVTLYSSVITAFVYDDKIFSPFHDVITEFNCVCIVEDGTEMNPKYLIGSEESCKFCLVVVLVVE